MAELGDKTQLAVVTQVCKFRRPWAVFAGASLALTMTTVLAAAVGHSLGQLIPQSVLQGGAAGAFLVIGVLVGLKALEVQGPRPSAEACEGPGQGAAGRADRSRGWQAFGSTLGLLFVAELGDKTQLGVLSLAGRYGSPWAVLLGGSLALIGVTALGVLGGEALCRLIPERTLLWLSAAVFVAMGALMAFGVL